MPPAADMLFATQVSRAAGASKGEPLLYTCFTSCCTTVQILTQAADMLFTTQVSRTAGGSKGERLLFSERLFIAIAWLPKATVQAALGGVAHALMKVLSLLALLVQKYKY